MSTFFSIDADVALWLDKRCLDGEPDLEVVRGGSFVLVTSIYKEGF